MFALVRRIAEYKGKQDLFKEQRADVLRVLKDNATIQSTESSNRIEGITATRERMDELMLRDGLPNNRPESEIVGYRNVLKLIHDSHENIPFTLNDVRFFHGRLFWFAANFGGHWKNTANDITEDRDGTKIVRFRTVAPYMVQPEMERLHEQYQAAFEKPNAEPLLLIPSYVLDFLCIHPFLDGNGRMARLLSLLLLCKSGYEVGRYISLERIIEQTKADYYETLLRSSIGWHENEHDLMPWLEYFLGVMLSAYQEFERRVLEHHDSKSLKRDTVLDAINDLPARFRFSDVQQACPAISAITIRRALRQLSKYKRIKCIRKGRDATWEKTQEWSS